MVFIDKNCAKLVDSDVRRFSVDVLRGWKSGAEAAARSEIQRSRVGGGLGSAFWAASFLDTLMVSIGALFFALVCLVLVAGNIDEEKVDAATTNWFVSFSGYAVVGLIVAGLVAVMVVFNKRGSHG